MGIRVHKAIGFGLIDIKTKKRGGSHVLSDRRINPRGYLGAAHESARWSYDAYTAFLKNFRWSMPGMPDQRAPLEEMYLHGDYTEQRKKIKSSFPHWSVEHDGEFGLPNVLLVIPPACVPDWRRYNATLDWCEETQCHGQEARVVQLKEPPYPWNVSREDLKTGRLIPGDWRWSSSNYGDVPGKNWRWVVPAEVAAICKFLKLFKSDETIRTLKPLLYVWWA